jgi:sulfite reductase beta subunit-like hemoprotein
MRDASLNTAGTTAVELPPAITATVREELDAYEELIRKYRAGEVDETKMQKQRLHFGTYAQRQEGVQMQRIKLPGGLLTSHQLESLADAADRFGSGFIHFTTREDAQLYYVRLDEVPTLLRSLAESGITTREACGNTVRNITCCYRSGTAKDEVFPVAPYAGALFRYLVRNRYNQNLGRKFKIAFEGCSVDHSRLRIHDIGLLARTLRDERGNLQRGFRVWLGGGLGAAPQMALPYCAFLPEGELFNLVTATLRLFDRYGERKARMKARMKFLIQTLGWDRFREELETERIRVGPVDLLAEYLEDPAESVPARVEPDQQPDVPEAPADSGFTSWARDSVIEHRIPQLRGVHVRLKLGDVTTERARGLALLARRFSAGQMRISIEQNIYFPWVRAEALPRLYAGLLALSLAEPGAETVADTTTCPGADTCRLGIASAKGLGSTLSDALGGELAEYGELSRTLRIKISGCPNACAQHSIADIGFQAAALNKDGRTVPAYLVSVGGRANLDDADFGSVIGRVPAKNGVQALQTLLELFRREKLANETFAAFATRMGEKRLKDTLEPLKQVPGYAEDPSYYEDWGHENERFAVRQGIRGECAGSTVAATVPTLAMARDWLAQGCAFLYHEEYESATLAAYEAAACAVRVPLYRRLVDPFTSDQALWEFENLFVLSGKTGDDWHNLFEWFETRKSQPADDISAREILERAQRLVEYCASFTEDSPKPVATAAGAEL